jgi:hypothetical protein
LLADLAPLLVRCSAVAADPRLADQMADQMREMMSNPERLQAMLNPRTQQAMQQMMQVGAWDAGRQAQPVR